MRFEFEFEGTNLAIEANLDELAALGKGVVELAENDISIQDIMSMVMSGRVPDSFNPDEKDEREELVRRLKETGAEVLKYGDDDLIECHTFCDATSNKEKAALVRAWLKSKSIKYKIDSTGIKKYIYQLSPIQLIELQRYLKGNEIVSCDCNI